MASHLDDDRPRYRRDALNAFLRPPPGTTGHRESDMVESLSSRRRRFVREKNSRHSLIRIVDLSPRKVGLTMRLVGGRISSLDRMGGVHVIAASR
jgi:hypothetical protein